ncbi:hypothetical protein CEXT_170371 [Caerostris extrusa]|uniref:DM13 domain-containing protein n=1 Tax=Caerostris extrusa TaxID=172846 RepID=A0AAV4M756_CAEEX|nr:hypothetical protein CEXT_170371 [Caerostris extrusa]
MAFRECGEILQKNTTHAGLNPASVILQMPLVIFGGGHCAPYFGSEIGLFKTHAHEVEGRVYAVDDRTLYIKGFSYDGQGPDAYFWAGTSSKPDATGFIIPDEKGKNKVGNKLGIKTLVNIQTIHGKEYKLADKSFPQPYFDSRVEAILLYE